MSVVRWTIGMAILAYCAAPAMAQSSIQTAFNYNLQDEADADAPPAPGAPQSEMDDAAPERSDGSYDDGQSACGCESDQSYSGDSCGCDSGCCDSGCCDNGWGSCLGDCCLGDAWTLQSCLTPCCSDHTYGGWVSMGYYNDNERFSIAPNDLLSFHDNPDNLNFDQVWFYGEKLASADACGCDWGYRVDVVYGVDAQKTQAFGNDGGTWDVTFDHGSYGWAIPQAYAEFAWSDWSAKVGHFFTPIGYEVIPVTGNFFYSHSFAMYNSEPFTHTGVLFTNTASDQLTLYAGWTLGWDTGFDQNQGGSNFLGGFGTQLTDDVKYTYLLTAGDFGARGDDGYEHANVLDFTLSECWNYVLVNDYLQVTNNDGFEEENVGIINYLFYTMSDCWKVGGRVEWWKSNFPTGESSSFYNITGGVNYRPHANVVVRPEVRYNWTPSEDAYTAAQGADFNQTLFAIDAVFTY